MVHQVWSLRSCKKSSLLGLAAYYRNCKLRIRHRGRPDCSIKCQRLCIAAMHKRHTVGRIHLNSSSIANTFSKLCINFKNHNHTVLLLEYVYVYLFKSSVFSQLLSVNTKYPIIFSVSVFSVYNITAVKLLNSELIYTDFVERSGI